MTPEDATLSERVREGYIGFRTRSVYFQLRILLIAAYSSVCIVTLAWVPPTDDTSNQIGAHILVLDGDEVMGRYFVIENESRQHWRRVSFELGEGYLVHRDVVPAGEKITLYVRDFKKKVIRVRRGREIPKITSAPVDGRYRKLTIRCSEGVAVEPISPTALGGGAA